MIVLHVVIIGMDIRSWVQSNCKFAQSKMIGYRCMRYENGMLISGADPRQRFAPKIGQIIRFPGKGIYLSTSKAFVMSYYSGLHDSEALLTMEFDPSHVLSGDPTMDDSEISVSAAKLVAVEPLKNN